MPADTLHLRYVVSWDTAARQGKGGGGSGGLEGEGGVVREANARYGWKRIVSIPLRIFYSSQ